MRCSYRVLVGKPEEKKKKSTLRPRRLREDNIKMNFQESEWRFELD